MSGVRTAPPVTAAPEPGRRPAPGPRLGAPQLGPARWVLAAAVFAAVLGSAISLRPVVLNFSWLAQAVVVLGLTVLGPALLRRAPRLHPWSPVGALAGLVSGLTVAFFSGTALLGFIPTLETVRAAAALSRAAGETIMVSNTPVPPDPALAFLLCAGLGLAALIVDTLAVTVALPAASGLGLVLILLPAALTTRTGVGLGGFLGAATGYLLLLGCCRWYAPDGRLRAASTAARSGTLVRGAGLGAAVVLAVLAASAWVPGFTSGSFPQGSRLGSLNNVSGLDPMISLGNDLRAQSSSVALSYLSDAPAAQYLRLSTLEEFSGRTWQPSPVPEGLDTGLAVLAPAVPLNTAVPLATTKTWLSLQDASGGWLPLPFQATSIEELRGRWLWNPSTQTVHGAGAVGEHNYAVTSVRPELSPALLAAASRPPSAALDPVFSRLPDDVPDIVRDTARRETDAATTPYAKALALQGYLRSPAFSYSVQTPVAEGYDGAGMGVLAKFLDVKSGYCVHFSAAMAVMAREVGIPSRIAVGYAPGRATQSSTEIDGVTWLGYEATGSDAHAWPELYFEGLGWIPFEPTPSRGVVPAYAQTAVVDPVAAAPDDFLNGAAAAPTAPAAAVPSATASTDPAAQPATETGQTRRWLATAGGALLALGLLAAPGLLRGGGARRRERQMLAVPSDPARPAVAAWRELSALGADYGLLLGPALTPAQQAQRLAALVGPHRQADVALLQGALEAARFGPPLTVEHTAPGAPPDPVRAQARAQLAQAVQRVRRELWRRATPLARVRAVLLPASLLHRRR